MVGNRAQYRIISKCTLVLFAVLITSTKGQNFSYNVKNRENLSNSDISLLSDKRRPKKVEKVKFLHEKTIQTMSEDKLGKSIHISYHKWIIYLLGII